MPAMRARHRAGATEMTQRMASAAAVTHVIVQIVNAARAAAAPPDPSGEAPISLINKRLIE